MLMKIVGAGAGAFAGDYVAQHFILRPSDDSPSGFITITDGFGVDDVVRYVLIAMGALAGMKLAGKFGG